MLEHHILYNLGYFFIFVSTEYLSGSTATNEKTMKVQLANIELTANHEEQQKDSGRLYSMIMGDTMYSYPKCLDQINLVNLEICEKELSIYEQLFRKF